MLTLWIGYISPRPPPRNTLPETLANAIVKFVNLDRVIFTPITFHEDLFVQTLCVLPDLRSLTNLTVNQSCTSDALAQGIVEVNGLKKLTLINPGRAILQLLPDWLHRLSPTLVELHLKVGTSLTFPKSKRTLHLKSPRITVALLLPAF